MTGVSRIEFDTPASNSDLKNGACTFIARISLGGLPPSRHETSTSCYFQLLIWCTGGPYFAMFRRFQQTWPSIDHTTYEVASDDMFDSNTSTASEGLHQRDDYKEFLQMSLIFFGSEKGARVSSRPPAATHHAMWMAKVIYNFK